MQRFTGKVVLVSGAGSGIGAAVASAFTDEGATVVASDLAGLDVVLDVTSASSCADAVAWTLEQHGRLDVLCNVAGIGISHPIGSFPESDWQRIFDINLHGTFRLSQAALPALLADGGGCIVNLASVSGLRGSPYNAGYAASKAAQISLTKSMAVELAKSGVRVNAVAPSAVATPFLDTFTLPEDADLGLLTRAAAPMGVVLDAEEVAAAVLYLASEEAKHVTGTILVLDGGASA
jgi:meso-butanediol dehydrogenase / (S,S)-butanediol dehydrogenase / diacetyl reductase